MKLARTSLTILTLLVASLGLPASATVWTVLSGDPIQPVINGSSPGDTIVIHDGVYDETLEIINKIDLRLVAAQVPSTVGSHSIGAGTPYFGATMVDGTSSSPGTPCLLIQDSHRISIVGLTFQHCMGNGIEVLSTTGFSPPIRDIHLTAIVVNNIDGTGIKVGFAARFQVRGSVITNGSGSGLIVHGRDSVIVDNSIGNHPDAGILILNGSQRAQIVNNQVQANNNYGILDQGNKSRIEWNTSTLNTICNIQLDPTSNNADVVGNDAAGSYCNLGTFNEFAENQ